MSYQVELNGIVKFYKTFCAVDHINLQISKGEIVSLLGASGCGKTTTLRMIAGLIAPTEGSVVIAGQDVTQVPPYKRDVAMVFQNYALFPHLSVFENVVYGLRNRGIKDKTSLEKKACEILSIVQLDGSEKKFPRQLSGGQQQRVSLARALIVEPRVMLFDEPLSNLDAKLRLQTRIEIRTLLKQLNITAIYVTHDQEEALTISDRIAVMHKGCIEQITEPTTLYNAPATKFVADFIGQANLYEGDIKACEKDFVRVSAQGGMEVCCTSPTGSCQVGARKAVLVRPENIHVSEKRGNADNSFPGQIAERSFLGSTIRYVIVLDNGGQAIAEAHPQEALQDVGNRVFISFHKNHTVLVDC